MFPAPRSRRIRPLVAMRLAPAAILALLLAFPAPAADPIPALRYPGPAGGPFTVETKPGNTPDTQLLELRNRALAGTWTLTDRGLAGVRFRDEAAHRALAITGEVFQILLADGTRFRASELPPRAAPHTTSLAPDPSASRLAARLPGHELRVPLRSPDGRLEAEWRVEARDDGNYLRQELRLRAPAGELDLREIQWGEALVPQAPVGGAVDGSPVVAGSFFLGAEDPMSRNGAEAVPGGTGFRVTCRQPRPAGLRQGEELVVSLVVGVAPERQMRRAFLHYLERERAHPYRPFLHYNSWYDIAWDPFALNETNCLDAIRLLGERFIRPHGVVLDSLVFDDGWDDPQTLWQFHRGFPSGFAPLAVAARSYDTRLGVWLSPFGGYGEPRDRRLRAGREQGYETNSSGFSLAGPKYYAAFRDACMTMIRRYGVNHFKFDGIAAGMSASGGAEYVRDTEAMRRLMLELRREAPDLHINLTTGSWPSPFWLRFADSLWRQGQDMGLAGPGSRQRQWLTYRDQEVYRNIVRRGPLYPLNALMTQGVAWSRHGLAGDPTFDSAGFREDVRAFFGAGTGLQELYIQPGRLGPADWAVLAEAARWSRSRAEVLVDTHWIGGDPGRGEAYGYASWCPRQGVVMLRNPSDQPRTFTLDPADAFELPAGAPATYRLASPWSDEAARPALHARAGTALAIPLEPFEIRVYDALPEP